MSEPAAGKIKGHERSAPLPASTTPAPPAPLISPTGNVAVDSLSQIVNRAAEPWQDLPNQTPVQKVATVVNGVLGILNMDVAVEAFNMGVGALSSLIPFPPLPAATLTSLHVGSPHTHTHPPSLVPPAPPIPLPSFGPVILGGCVSVLINGLPAARASDLGISVICGTLAPPFEVYTGSSSVFIGGSRAARMGDLTKHCGAAIPGEFSAIGVGFAAAVGLLNAAAAPNGMAMAMAAAQTAADAAKAAMAALMGSDPGVPPCVGMLMTGHPNVMIGGLPIPPIENFARAFFQKLLKPLANALHSMIHRTLGPGRAANFFHELVCHTTGHPVDVASGRMLTSAVDLELPGPIPLKLKRQYATSWSNRDSVLGWGWSHSYDEAVWSEPDGSEGAMKTVYRAEDGRELEFETANAEARPTWLQSNEHWDPFNRLTLRVMGKAHWEIESVDGITREFRAPVDGRRVAGSGSIVPGAPLAAGRRDLARLTLIRDRAGNRMSFDYDSAGNLDTIIDSGGREIRLEKDRAGRLQRILVPHPTTSGFVEHVRYAYSAAGDLVEVYDAAGQPFSMAYEGHVLIRETNRNGLSFYFKYDGGGPEVRCVKTWGDGDIYTRRLIYDVVNHTTIVEDSYGHKTTYQMNADNAVVGVTDALGGATRYVFDSAYHKISETDAVGGETKWEYDARGNCTKITSPDGAEVTIDFNDRNQPVSAIDPMKGKWQWGYDGRGMLVVRVDPLERRVRFVWQADPNAGSPGPSGARRPEDPPPPKRMVAVFDPADQKTTLTYDPAGNVTGLRAQNGVDTRWKFDNLGQCVVAVDAKGNQQVREHDVLGRVNRVRAPDGNMRELTFDAEGNVLTARDRQHDVRFTYQGMGRLRSRTEAGTTVEFEYDREERLIGIKNQHGHVYRFELGPTGKLLTEAAFDGVTRKYERDVAGRVTKVHRPDKRFTTYEYDTGGRVIELKHSDGDAQAYAYREDGALVQAKNSGGLVTLERDKLGRVVKEIVGDDWVESAYDVRGMRVEIRSSRGLHQRIARNGQGHVLGIHASTKRGTGAPAVDASIRGDERSADVTWDVSFQRDSVGLEMERSLPGGVSARWERDALGRPKSHSIGAGSLSKAAWHYTWDVNDRLSKVVDLMKGPTQYQHDALGSLAAATYADGKVDLRMPDAVGNLFRTANRDDRKYGPAGQLLEARDARGGVTRYEYDPEGHLVKRIDLDAAAVARLEQGRAQMPDSPGPVGGAGDVGRVWTYEWNDAGMLSKVVRPDNAVVEFSYDALGRRLWKRFRDATTRWIWDGNVPLHEWVEGAAGQDVDQAAGTRLADLALDEAVARRRQAEKAALPANGPPESPEHSAPVSSLANLACEPGAADAPITWLFEPESNTPIAKIVGDSRYGIVSDHLGIPKAMYDAMGVEVWSADIDAYGDLRDVQGHVQACPFRWPGQYHDAETGLSYNRFRYYDPSSGQYIRRDPIGLFGGLAAYAYVQNPLRDRDPMGLSCADDLPEEHQKAYEDGASFFVPASVWKDLKASLTRMGYADGLFVTSRSEADRLVATSDREGVKKRLGVPERFWNESLVRLDVADPMSHNPRLPTGTEKGANEQFVPGGHTSGGAVEMVIDPVPMSQLTESGPFF